MLILAIDTAFQSGGAALVEGERLLGEIILGGDTTHSRRLLAGIDYLLEQAGRRRGDLTGVAVDLGPGYFTGLRIGLATAQGLALGLEIPCWGCSSLRLLAQGVGGWRGRLWAVADARRGLVYAAPFEMDAEGLHRLEPDAAMSPERLTGLLKPPALLVGDGARLYAEKLLSPGVELAPAWCDTPRPALLALAARRPLEEGAGVMPEQLVPRYVRPSDAEVRFGLPLDGYRLLD